MDIFRIKGPVQLSGTVTINGSKNASLPIMAAAILTTGRSVLKSVPHLSDISVFSQLLSRLGFKVTRADNGDLYIDSTVIDNPVGEYEIVRRMRASICILGPLLARCGKARVSMPGGCAIGDRPINIHLRGLAALRRLGEPRGSRGFCLRGKRRMMVGSGDQREVMARSWRGAAEIGLAARNRVRCGRCGHGDADRHME